MAKLKSLKPVVAVTGAAILATALTAPVVAAESPFATQAFLSGKTFAEGEGSCSGEGSCGGEGEGSCSGEEGKGEGACKS